MSLEISVPGGSEILPRLGLADGCEDVDGGGLAVIERSATHLILAVEDPGAYVFRSAAQDPRRRLPDYRLTASFYEAPASRPAMIDDVTTKEEPVAVDPDPDSSAEEPVAVDPDPDSVSAGSAIGRLLGGLCRAARSDDHGDTSTCATPVGPGSGTDGELANDWGDDHDFFTFTLAELETVFIGTVGTTDTFGSLFGPSGQLLATDDDGGDGSNFLIVRTLSPGRYSVRVEGSRFAEGPYELVLVPAAW